MFFDFQMTSVIVRLWADITADLIKWVVVLYTGLMSNLTFMGACEVVNRLHPPICREAAWPHWLDKALLDGGWINRLHVGMWPDFPFVSRCLFYITCLPWWFATRRLGTLETAFWGFSPFCSCAKSGSQNLALSSKAWPGCWWMMLKDETS